MIIQLLLIAAVAISVAWWAAKRPESADPTWLELVRWAVVVAGWAILGSDFVNLLLSFLVTQAVYVPAFNYWTGKDIWFIDNDTWLGKLIVKYLGEGSGRVWFWVQLAAAAVLLILF